MHAVTRTLHTLPHMRQRLCVHAEEMGGGARRAARAGSASAAKPSVSNSGFSARADEATGGVFSVAAEGSAGPSVTSSASPARAAPEATAKLGLRWGRTLARISCGRVPVRPHPEGARGVSPWRRRSVFV